MRVMGGELAGSVRAVGSAQVAVGSGGSSDALIGDLDHMVDSLTRLSSLCGLDPDCGDAVRIERIAMLERLQAAAFAAQAAELARFADAQEVEQRRLGVPARRVGVGIADLVALACRVSPVTGARRLGLAGILIEQLPCTYAHPPTQSTASTRNDDVRDHGDAGCGGVADRARVFLRRIVTDPIDHTVAAVDTRRPASTVPSPAT